MNKGNLLVGPELLWVLFYVMIIVISKVTNSPVRSMDNFWEKSWLFVPLILLPLSYLIYYVPGAIHKWMVLRLLIAGLVGSHFVLAKGLENHSEGGPGVGTAYIVGIGLVMVVLVVGTIFALIKFR